MTGRTLEEIRRAAKLHPSTFARALGYTEPQLKKRVKKEYDEPITERDFMLRIAKVIPALVIQRIQELQQEVQSLQRFGPPLDDLKKRLTAEFKQDRWKDRFDSPEGKYQVDRDHSQEEARIVEDLANAEPNPVEQGS